LRTHPEDSILQTAIYQDDLDDNEDQTVAEWYNTLSPSYDELYSQEQSFKHKAVVEFLKNERFKILVDVGCGSGTFLQTSQQLYQYAVGIDISREMLKTAKKKIPAKIDLVLAASRTLPIKNQAVDGLVSISTLKADSSLPKLLTEMTRICRKNGVLAVSLFQKPESEIPPLLSDSEQSVVSDRETLYFLRQNR
jgi:ubiquinone/menaquinone biosynthesis C-methylase UbiE